MTREFEDTLTKLGMNNERKVNVEELLENVAPPVFYEGLEGGNSFIQDFEEFNEESLSFPHVENWAEDEKFFYIQLECKDKHCGKDVWDITHFYFKIEKDNLENFARFYIIK